MTKVFKGRCFNCHEEGHQCPKMAKEGSSGQIYVIEVDPITASKPPRDQEKATLEDIPLFLGLLFVSYLIQGITFLCS